MAIEKPNVNQMGWGPVLNNALDAIDDRLIAIEAVVEERIPLPDFLTYVEGREHLPTLNTNFGWDENGVWFGNADEGTSYPIFTDFTIPTNAKVQVEFDVEIDSFCSDAGMCVYVNGTTPEWNYGTSPNRIAVQFNCPNLEIEGIEDSTSSEGGVDDPGVYRMVMVYDPEDTTDNVIFRVMTTGNSPTLVNEISLTETLPTGAYRIGFASDLNPNEGNDGDTRTYISNLSISINNGTTVYADTLQEGTSGNSSADTGDITFDGVQIIGAGEASGDGNNYSTLELVPDADLYSGDQYLVIDPTGPNHIHIRAGGDPDESNAELFLGGERNRIKIDDSQRLIEVTTRPETVQNTYTNTMESNGTEMLVPSSANIQEGTTVNVGGTEYEVTTFESDPSNEGFSTVAATGASFIAGNSYTFTYEETYDNYWEFGSDGVLYGPSMGGLRVNGLTAAAGTDLYIYASTDQDVFVSNGDTQALVGYRYLPQENRSSDFTLELSHMGKHIYNTVNGQIELTIPTNASVPFPIGTEIKLVNDSTASMLITRENTDTMVLVAEGQGYTNEDIVFWLPSDGLATLLKVSTNKWILSGLRVND